MKGRKLMKNLGKISMLIVLLFTLGFVLRGVLEKEERRECFQWQDWVKEIRDFKPSSAMQDQCNYWGIKIDAPVLTKKEGVDI